MDKIKHELIDGLTQHSLVIVVGNVVLALLNTILLYQRIDTSILVVWNLSVIAVIISGILLNRLYKSGGKASWTYSQWHQSFITLAFLRGLCWGAMGLYLASIFPLSDLIVFLITVTGITGGSITTNSFSKQSFLAFALPANIPLGIYYISTGSINEALVGCMFFLYFALTFRSTSNINDIIIDNLEKKYELMDSKALVEAQAKQLYSLSTIDVLTQVLNRRGFNEVFEREMKRARRNKGGLALMMIDVDDFKGYNDKLGHQAGDECLSQIAAELSRHCRREGDWVARYGGEEFAIILSDIKTKDACLAVAEGILDGIRKLVLPHPLDDIDYVSVSIGIFNIDKVENISANEFIESADKQLYIAKSEGKNCARIQ